MEGPCGQLWELKTRGKPNNRGASKTLWDLAPGEQISSHSKCQRKTPEAAREGGKGTLYNTPEHATSEQGLPSEGTRPEPSQLIGEEKYPPPAHSTSPVPAEVGGKRRNTWEAHSQRHRLTERLSPNRGTENASLPKPLTPITKNYSPQLLCQEHHAQLSRKKSQDIKKKKNTIGRDRTSIVSETRHGKGYWHYQTKNFFILRLKC